jgi:protein-S-isoprenylcysteine O-methyltransferase Ste14
MRSIGAPELMVLFGILFLFAFVLVLLAAALRWKQSRSVQRALIDKLPANELSGLLQTPLGEKLLRALSEVSASPGRSILTSVQRGIVVIVSGLGLALAAALTRSPMVVVAIAIMLIFVGIGLLVAAFVAYRLSKRWHLLEENGGGPSTRRAD